MHITPVGINANYVRFYHNLLCLFTEMSDTITRIHADDHLRPAASNACDQAVSLRNFYPFSLDLSHLPFLSTKVHLGSSCSHDGSPCCSYGCACELADDHHSSFDTDHSNPVSGARGGGCDRCCYFAVSSAYGKDGSCRCDACHNLPEDCECAIV